MSGFHQPITGVPASLAVEALERMGQHHREATNRLQAIESELIQLRQHVASLEAQARYAQPSRSI